MDYQFKAAETTYSLDAEKAILGNILLYNQNIELVEDKLLVEDFMISVIRLFTSSFVF